jgi:predicted phosphodiesterase
MYDGQLLFNPGSPTDRRRQPQGTMGELVVDKGKVQARIIPVTDAVRVRPHGRSTRA